MKVGPHDPVLCYVEKMEYVMPPSMEKVQITG